MLALAAAAIAYHPEREARALSAAEPPSTMRSITQDGLCGPPYSCVRVHSVPVPAPTLGQCLVHVRASSVNPSNYKGAQGGACATGCGTDAAGTIVRCNGTSINFKTGDRVWMLTSAAYADYAVEWQFDARGSC